MDHEGERGEDAGEQQGSVQGSSRGDRRMGFGQGSTLLSVSLRDSTRKQQEWFREKYAPGVDDQIESWVS
jgi:hypothetical protein